MKVDTTLTLFIARYRYAWRNRTPLRKSGIVLSLPLVLIGLSPMGWAQDKMLGPTKEEFAKICGERKRCELIRAAVPGRAEDGTYLMVVQVRFPRTPAMIANPDLACRPMQEDIAEPNGGYEFWLMKGSNEPKKILALCNDGYGAAGTGEDKVTIADSLLIHMQQGGSAWLWVIT